MGKSILLKWCDGCVAVCFTMFLIWDIASVSFMSFIQNSFLMLINTCLVGFGVLLCCFLLPDDIDVKTETCWLRIMFYLCFSTYLMTVCKTWTAFLIFYLVIVLAIIVLAFDLLDRKIASVIISIGLSVYSIVWFFTPYTTSLPKSELLRFGYMQEAEITSVTRWNKTFASDNNFNSSEKKILAANLFNIKALENIILKKTEKNIRQENDYVLEYDKTLQTLSKPLETKLEKLRQTCKNKEEKLTITRLWLNSDVLPWSYQAYASVMLQLRHSLFSSNARLSLNGYAYYTGDTKLNYVNAILSDGTYLCYQIKDHQLWLLAREGDTVIRRYKEKNFSLEHYITNNLDKNLSDSYFDKTYVLLLNK